MPDRTVKRRRKMPATPRSPQMTARFSRPLPSWSRRSSAPFPRERKTQSERKKTCALDVSSTKY